MDDLNYFDCSCRIGMSRIRNPGSFYKLEDLVTKMNYYGIKKALVYHTLAWEYHPACGNEILLENIKEHECLYPVWVVMPHHTGEFPAPVELLKTMKKYNIRAVRMFPAFQENNYSFSEWNCGGLFSAFEEYQVPLFIGMDQIDFDTLYNVASNHPQLKFILTDVNYRMDRNLYPVLESFKNIYVETSAYKVHKGIENICSRFGSQRLIFGSSMPLFSGGTAVTMIKYANISESDKVKIARKNLEEILGGVKY